MSDATHVDLLVIGSGPGGQKAAIAGAKAGADVVLVESARSIGGSCVQYGTIPSKTLRQLALSWAQADRLHPYEREEQRALPMGELKTRVDSVLAHHSRFMRDQLLRNGVAIERGRASFESPHELCVTTPRGAARRFEADFVVVATGSRPRTLEAVPVDHEHVLDSDSILSLSYLPESLVVLGGGVIACEYASIFARMGTEVTMVDRAPRPLVFLDPELSAGFVEALTGMGGHYLPEQKALSIQWDGFSRNMIALEGDRFVEAEKILVALGRSGYVEGLALERAGLEANSRGLLDVDEHLRTAVPHIYAVGDLIGPPALATTAMEQGRRAVQHAVGSSPANDVSSLPVGIYTIPDISTIGANEEEARKKGREVVVGVAHFREVARALINGEPEGWLKLVVEVGSERLLGVQVIGEGATDLVHLGQMAILAERTINDLIETAFNFPTLAEAYRIASLDALGRIEARRG